MALNSNAFIRLGFSWNVWRYKTQPGPGVQAYSRRYIVYCVYTTSHRLRHAHKNKWFELQEVFNYSDEC